MLTLTDARSGASARELATQGLLIALISELPEERRQKLLRDVAQLRESADTVSGVADLAARERLHAAAGLIGHWIEQAPFLG